MRRSRAWTWMTCATAAAGIALAPAARATSWTSIGPHGGIMQALAVDPAHPGTIYLGTYIAGMFKTTDHGASWAPVGWGPLTTYAIAIDPAATATVFAADWASIFRSSDAGATWSSVASFPNHGVYGIAVDPTTHTNVYAAVYDVGVVKSSDGGDTWMPKIAGL